MQQRAFLIIATGPVAAFPVLPFCKGEPFSRILCGFVPGGDEFVLLAVADANAVGLELMPVCRVGLTWQASSVSLLALWLVQRISQPLQLAASQWSAQWS